MGKNLTRSAGVKTTKREHCGQAAHVGAATLLYLRLRTASLAPASSKLYRSLSLGERAPCTPNLFHWPALQCWASYPSSIPIPRTARPLARSGHRENQIRHAGFGIRHGKVTVDVSWSGRSEERGSAPSSLPLPTINHDRGACTAALAHARRPRPARANRARELGPQCSATPLAAAQTQRGGRSDGREQEASTHREGPPGRHAT